MGWFSKPKNSEIYNIELPEDENDSTKLKGKHKVIVDKVENDSVKVIGCSSQQKDGDVKVQTNKPLNKETYARPQQGLREVELNKFNDKTKDNDINCTNMKEITRKLK